jgi:hypothetical protein
MKTQRFLLELFLVSLLLAALVVGLGWIFPFFFTHAQVAYWMLAMLCGLSFPMFFLGKVAAKSPRKNMFSQLMLFFIFTKMMCSVALIVVYQQKYKPQDKYFIIPFIFIYFAFTAYETYFMLKISKTNA